MRRVLFLPFFLLIFGSCDGGGGGGDGEVIIEESPNICFSAESANPCFEEGAVVDTSRVSGETPDEVISNLENSPGFLRELDVKEILITLNYSYFLPHLDPACRWDESVIIINTREDWSRFTNNCYFENNSFVNFPSVDLSENTVIVSYQDYSGFGTKIVSVLEFDSSIVVVTADTVSDVPSSGPGYPSHIVRVEKTGKPVEVVRVESICNSLYNLSSSGCLAESLKNVCETYTCQFDIGWKSPESKDCSVLSCTSIECSGIDVRKDNRIVSVPGTFIDLTVGGAHTPEGLIDIEGNLYDVSCEPIVE